MLESDKKVIYPLCISIITLMMTASVISLLYINQKNHIVMLFDSHAEHQASILDTLVGNDVSFIGSAANFLHATEGVMCKDLTFLPMGLCQHPTALSVCNG